MHVRFVHQRKKNKIAERCTHLGAVFLNGSPRKSKELIMLNTWAGFELKGKNLIRKGNNKEK